MKSKDFQAPVLFSSTFKALNLAEKNSRTFKDAWKPCDNNDDDSDDADDDDNDDDADDNDRDNDEDSSLLFSSSTKTRRSYHKLLNHCSVVKSAGNMQWAEPGKILYVNSCLIG